jgi:hypothetical protein
LYGVVNHFGAMGAGHYVAYALSPADDRWHCFNDRAVTDLDPGDIVSPAAYLLFYVRRDVAAGWAAALRAEDQETGRAGAASPAGTGLSARSGGGGDAADDLDVPPLDVPDIFPRAPGAAPVDMAKLKAAIAAAAGSGGGGGSGSGGGVTVDALGVLDGLTDKCMVQ